MKLNGRHPAHGSPPNDRVEAAAMRTIAGEVDSCLILASSPSTGEVLEKHRSGSDDPEAFRPNTLRVGAVFVLAHDVLELARKRGWYKRNRHGYRAPRGFNERRAASRATAGRAA